MGGGDFGRFVVLALVAVGEAVVILLAGLALKGAFPTGSKYGRVPSFVGEAAAAFMALQGGWYFGNGGFSVWGALLSAAIFYAATFPLRWELARREKLKAAGGEVF